MPKGGRKQKLPQKANYLSELVKIGKLKVEKKAKATTY